MSKNKYKLGEMVVELNELRRQFHEAQQAKLDRQFKALASMKKPELLEYARRLTVQNMRLTAEQRLAELKGEVNVLESDRVHERTKEKQRRGARATKQRKDELWTHRAERFRFFRAEGYKKTDACRKIRHEEKEHGRTVSLKTLMRKLKE